MLFLSDFNETWTSFTDFRKILMKIFSVGDELFHVDVRMDRQTDMKLKVTFWNFANVPENSWHWNDSDRLKKKRINVNIFTCLVCGRFCYSFPVEMDSCEYIMPTPVNLTISFLILTRTEIAALFQYILHRPSKLFPNLQKWEAECTDSTKATFIFPSVCIRETR